MVATSDAPVPSRPEAAPIESPVLEYLAALHAELATLDDGEVATYIPELGLADPASFGIAVATADGHVYEVGDTRLPFTIQSISKPFVFGLALEDRGRDAVLAKVGVEPSGNPFNAITVDPATNRPWNPMVNAGAIVTTGLVDGRDARPAVRAHPGDVRALRRSPARRRRRRAAVGDRDRRPQPRDRVPDAVVRDARR